MKEYLTSLLLVTAVATLATLLIPEEDGKLRRLIEFGLALLVLTAVLRPLSNLREFPLPENIFSDIENTGTGELPPETLQSMGEGIARGIERDLAARYRIPADCIRATVTPVLQEGELKVAHLQLSFRGAALACDLLAVEEYAKTTYGGECEVINNGF